MNVQITFDNLERIDSLETHVDEHLTSVLEKFGEDNFSSCHVRLGKCNSRAHSQRLIFNCEIDVASAQYSAIHIKKEADDIHRAINEVGQKLNNLISREHKSRITRRHNLRAPSLESTAAPETEPALYTAK